MQAAAYPKAAISQYHRSGEIDQSTFVNIELKDKHRLNHGLDIATEDLRKYIASAPSGPEADIRTAVRFATLHTCDNTTNSSVTEESSEDDDEEEDAFTHPDALTLNIPDCSPTVWEAAKSGDALALEQAVMMTGLDPSLVVNMRDPDTESTLLYLSVAHTQTPFPLIEFLLLHGADPNRHNIYNVHAIHALSLHCPNPVRPMELLLEHEADPNARDGDDWTPLHYCARFCKDPLPVMELLVRHGANINATDVSKKSPMFALLANGDHPSVIDWLIHSAKADVSLKGDFMNQKRSTYPGTVFLQAVKYARIASLRVLVDSEVSYERLKRAMNRQEFESAMEMILKFRDQNKPEDLANEMFAILLSFRQRLEDDFESLVYFERTGQQFTGMLSRRQPILGTFRRKPRPISAVTEHTEEHHTTEDEQQLTQRSPNLLKRLSALFIRQKSTVE